MGDHTSSTFPDMAKSGVTSDAQKGAFKGANDLGKMPTGGATSEGVGGIERKAQMFAIRHSTKALRSPKPFTTKVKPITNEAKAIGRKRGY